MRWGIATALTAFLLALPGSALAAPPANDNFADREVVGPGFPGGLPIEVTGSNEEATPESGENLSFYAAGHSVWFEWEATSTDWVSVGTCDSEIAAVLGIFTVSEGGLFSRVVEGNPSEGPHCPFRQTEYTFKAKAGTKYMIGVDGNGFPGPEAGPVDTEGEVRLRIEATPPPANDDFADAADLTAAAKTYEFESDELFYFARLESYNWGAGKEPGEPDHQVPGEPGRQSDPGGASAWYEWTAPASGPARMTMCCFGAPLLGIYTGGSVDGLAAVPTESEIWPEVRAEVIAGQTYWIAVDGVYDEATGEAAQVFYSVNVMMDLPRRPVPTGPSVELNQSQQDVTAPETTISRRILKRKPPVFIYGFGSNEPGSAFLCSLDRRPFAPCGPRRMFKKPIPGRHRLRVFAIDAAGNADPTPAVARFSFPRSQQSRGTQGLNG